jgi:carbon monoxide dehydrogenase subunit G
MRLSFSGAPEVAAARAGVWPRILDPHVVAKHSPGVKSVGILDPRHYKGITGFGGEAIKLRFGIDVEQTGVNPHDSFTRDGGGAPGSAVQVTAPSA